MAFSGRGARSADDPNSTLRARQAGRNNLDGFGVSNVPACESRRRDATVRTFMPTDQHPEILI